MTSFPQRWNKSKEKDDDDPDPDNTSDIVDTIVRHIGKRDRRPITSVYDLAELIVSKCTSTMFEHADVSNEKLRFSEFFEVSIGNVVRSTVKGVASHVLTSSRRTQSLKCSTSFRSCLKSSRQVIK